VKGGIMLYYKFSDYLKERYGQKVYKLPLNLPVTCPNRDGCVGYGGCIFCGEEGAGFETLPSVLSVSQQLSENKSYIGRNYGASKFIAYFQNYSNTYLPLSEFRKSMYEAIQEDIVALYISTRPDCIGDEYIEVLSGIKKERDIDIVVELGLQTVNYHTLKRLGRGHGLAEFIDAAIRLKSSNIGVCAHYIVDVPYDDITDVTEGAKILSALGVDQVKCHSLYILEGTALGEMYKNGQISHISFDDFLERTVSFLENLSPNIVVQRLLGRAPEERSLFCNFSMSWWKIKDLIEEKMISEGRYQGGKQSCLNGAATLYNLRNK